MFLEVGILKPSPPLTMILLPLLTLSLLQPPQLYPIFSGANYLAVAPSPTSTQLPTKTFDSHAPMPASPVTGTRDVLVILIDFPDRAGVKNQTYYQNLLFSDRVGSLKHYYTEASYGKFTVNGTIAGTGWYRSGKNMTWWGADKTDHDDKNEPVYNLAKEAIGKADAHVNFTAYDKNKDNVLQTSELSVWIIHAGPGQESTRSSTDIWSHRWAIPGVGFDSLPDFYVDGVRVSLRREGEDVCGYAMEAEDSPMGTFAHEYGHELGLPDLYNTGVGGEFLGKWDIMATGSWNGNPQGSSPAHFTSWSKIKLGWISTSDITTVSTGRVVNVTISPLETSNVSVIKIPTGSTYYLVEARQRMLYDSSLPSHGVLILYCDDSVESGKGPVRAINAHPSDGTLDHAPFNVGAGENSTFIDASRGITVTVLSASNSSFAVKVNYNAGNVRISTEPPGLTIQVDGVNYTAPNAFIWASGSTHTISVPEIQGNGSVRHLFLGWSDGRNRTHTVMANASDITITASYRTQYFLNVSSSHGVTSGSGWYDNGTVAYAGLNTGVIDAGNGSRLRFAYWSGNASGTVFNRSNPILMDGVRSAIANWKMQYEVSLSFKTWDGSIPLHPRRCQIAGASPNGTLITLSSFSHVWLDGVRWSVVQVLWQGSNIVPNVTVSYIPTALGKWVINCSVYYASFADAFKASDGSSLYVKPSSFRLVFPNGTLSEPLSPSSSYLLQNGSYELRAVYWQGSEVTPDDNRFTSTSPSIRSFNLRIYKVDFTDSFRDSKGFNLSTKASGFSLLCPNGSSTGLLPLGSYLLQNGTFELRFIYWKGFEVLPTPNAVFNPADGNPRINFAISDLTITVKDVLGLTVSDAKVDIIYAANGTTIARATTSSDGKATFLQLPDNNYRAEVTFLGSTSKTFTLAGDKTVEVTVLLSYPVLGILLSVAAASIGIAVLAVRRRHHLD